MIQGPWLYPDLYDSSLLRTEVRPMLHLLCFVFFHTIHGPISLHSCKVSYETLRVLASCIKSHPYTPLSVSFIRSLCCQLDSDPHTCLDLSVILPFLRNSSPWSHMAQYFLTPSYPLVSVTYIHPLTPQLYTRIYPSTLDLVTVKIPKPRIDSGHL